MLSVQVECSGLVQGVAGSRLGLVGRVFAKECIFMCFMKGKRLINFGLVIALFR